nr:NlpC/P60 family protein [Lactobacillus delbrueckii]
MYVYKKATGLSLPHYSVSQLYYGKAVSTKKLVKGDLLFFGSKSAPSHVGIYVGGGKLVHASSPTVGVIKSKVSTNRSSAFFLPIQRAESNLSRVLILHFSASLSRMNLSQ